MVFSLQYYAIPIAISCQSLCLSVPGGDGEKLTHQWLRQGKQGWMDGARPRRQPMARVRIRLRERNPVRLSPRMASWWLGLIPGPWSSPKSQHQSPSHSPPAQRGASPQLTPGWQRAGSAPPWQWQEHAPGCDRGRCHSEAWGRVPGAQPERIYWLHLFSVTSEAFALQFYHILTLFNVIT